MPDKMTRKQFAEWLKKQRPELAGFDDDALVNGVLQRRPDLSSKLMDAGPMPPKGEISTGPHGMEALAALVQKNMPLLMGTAGGLGGAAIGGPVGAVIGAGAGGGGGELMKHLIGFGKGKGMGEDLGTDVAISGIENAGAELGGLAIGKVGQWIKGPAREALISYATRSGQLGPEIKAVLPDLDRMANKLGANVSDVASLRRLGHLTERGLNQEFNAAIQPIAQQRLVPISVANEIQAQITNNPNLANTAEGQRVIAQLKRRALEFQSVRPGGQPWTIGDLNLERMRLTKKLEAYHAAVDKGAVIRPGIKADMDADAAAERALKDLLYNAADKSGVKPLGYFQALKQRQSALISLNQSIQKGEEGIAKQSLERQGAPLSEKLHLRTYAHPGSAKPGGVLGFNPLQGDPLSAANRQASRAFPSTAGKVVNAGRKALGTTISQPDVNALALRSLLFGDFSTQQEPEAPRP